MKREFLFGILALVVVTFSHASAEKPNVILIVLDDAGYGDFSCYDTSHLKTPNVDLLRAQGMKFNQFYAGSTVCAPSRCVLMTGQHSGHCRVRGNKPGALLPEDVTIAELMKQAGYRTACIGKWGIGAELPLDDPNRNGFDEFFGYISMWHAHNFYPEFLIHNGTKSPLRNVVMEQWKQDDGRGVATQKVDYAPEVLTQRVLNYIDENKSEPFFLYYALNVPHANNEGGRFNPAEEKGMEVRDFGPYADQAWPGPEKGFAAMMRNIDLAVGQIIDQLLLSGIDEETVIFITSDNGPHQEGGHKMEYFDSNGPLRGMKRDLYEGGIRVPLIVRWSGHIPRMSETNHISAFQDLLPTIAELAEVEAPKNIDGISFVPTLLNQKDQRAHDFLYWEFTEQGGKRAIRQGDWKLVQTDVSKQSPKRPELYHLPDDLGETKNVASEQPEVVDRLAKLMDQAHTENSAFPLFASEQ